LSRRGGGGGEGGHGGNGGAVSIICTKDLYLYYTGYGYPIRADGAAGAVGGRAGSGFSSGPSGKGGNGGNGGQIDLYAKGNLIVNDSPKLATLGGMGADGGASVLFGEDRGYAGKGGDGGVIRLRAVKEIKPLRAGGYQLSLDDGWWQSGRTTGRPS